MPLLEMAAADKHIASCPECQRELAPTVAALAMWHADLEPKPSLQARLATGCTCLLITSTKDVLR